MGFLGEFRKLLFGVQSVSKSGAEKVVTKGKEIGEDLIDSGADYLDKGKDMAGDAFEVGKEAAGKAVDKIGDTLGDLKDRAKDLLDDFSDNPAVEKAANVTEGVGKKVLDASDKAGDFTSKVGEKVIEVGGDAAEKAAELSEKVGEKLLDVKDKVMEKASELGDKLSNKYDETYEKAKELEAQEALEPKGEFAEDMLDASGSLLEDTDDFFSKAAKYADGNYSGKKDNTKVTPPIVDETKTLQVGETTILLPEGDASEKEMGKLAGFEDLDGDGNELVDDAILVEEGGDVMAEADVVVEESTSSITEEVTEKAAGLATTVGGMVAGASDKIKSEVDTKLSEMEDMMGKVLGEEE